MERTIRRIMNLVTRHGRLVTDKIYDEYFIESVYFHHDTTWRFGPFTVDQNRSNRPDVDCSHVGSDHLNAFGVRLATIHHGEDYTQLVAPPWVKRTRKAIKSLNSRRLKLMRRLRRRDQKPSARPDDDIPF